MALPSSSSRSWIFLVVSLSKAVTLPLSFHLCWYPMIDLFPSLFLNYYNHFPSYLTISFVCPSKTAQLPLSNNLMLSFLDFKAIKDWWTKCKALSLNRQSCRRTWLYILTLFHPLPHTHTSFHILQLRLFTVFQKWLTLQFPIVLYVHTVCSADSVCNIGLLIFKSKSSHQQSFLSLSHYNMWQLHSLICCIHAPVSPLWHLNSTLLYRHLYI